MFQLCISKLQTTFKTLSPATYLLDRFGHPLRSVWILLASTLRPMDLEHSLSQPPSFGKNYLTTYVHTRIKVILKANLKPTFLRTFTLVIRKTKVLLLLLMLLFIWTKAVLTDVLSRFGIWQATCKCFAIPSFIHCQCGYEWQARFALGGVLFHQGARGRIFRFLRSTSQQIFRNIYYLFKQQF